MASSTFLNLPIEKQNKLLQAAFNEFSRVSYEEASINKIISEAGIPRGSFYMYFNDKLDLYSYLIRRDRIRLQENILKLLKDLDGDFVLVWEQMYKNIINYCTNEKHYNFYKQFFIGMRFSFEKHIMIKPTEQEMILYKKEVIENINKTLYNIKSEEELFDAYMFVQMTTLASITFHFMNCSKNNNYQTRLNIIKNGLYERKEQ